MKTSQTQEEFEWTMKQELSVDIHQKIKELTDITEDQEAFSIEGELFMGNRFMLAREYTLLNPSKKFRIWLIDKGYKITEN